MSRPRRASPARRCRRRGATWLDPEISRILLHPSRSSQQTLSPRELQTLRLLTDGHTNEEIADRLDCAPATVKTHLLHLFEKMGVHDRVSAAVTALRGGLLVYRAPSNPSRARVKRSRRAESSAAMSRMTEWVDFPDGRARFCGGTRGWDERGRETFAVELDGRASYGEVDSAYDGNSMFLQISHFGYAAEESVGIPGGAETFSADEALRVRDLVRRLVVTVDGYAHDDKPFPLRVPAGAVFTGDVVFLDGWIVISNG